MEEIVLKKATEKDLYLLQKIGKQTFDETFSADNSVENMAKYLEEGFSIEKLSAELNDENAAFYLATLNDLVIGYLKLNLGQAQTELKDNNALEIERIYVLKEYHGKKVGQLLYEKAIQVATQLNVHYIWLGVWEKNSRAIQFYKKNGFVEFGQHIFKLGNDEQTDIMMKRLLKDA
jgi:ribosomal protein S18 acetylase RimI-like enzyme